MHILIDSGSYHSLNVGDVAMLQAAIERLRDLWPEASIAVVTNAPETLALHCLHVDPVPLSGRLALVSDRFLGRADRFVPRPVRDTLTRIEHRMRHEWPQGLGALISAKRALALRSDYAAPRRYVDAVRRADLVVATGAGVFTDAFLENAMGVLTTLQLALQWNIPVVAMGQGIGPVSNEALKRRMADVLPRLDLIALREHRESLRLLASLGVRPERIVVTGDDAIELANRRAPIELGRAIGVNVRLAGYAGTRGPAVDVVGPVLKCVGRRLAAPLVPVPIAHHPDCHDGIAIRDLLSEGADRSEPVVDLDTPAKAMAEVSRCRVVVTGSYHAAVFALAQGIPVVALAATPYYFNKFSGLADLFGGGCDIVALDTPAAAAHLESAIDSAWAAAPRSHESLLRAARAQIEQGRAAYRRLGGLIDLPSAGARAGVASPRNAVPLDV